MIANLEIVAVTSPKALGEVLVTKVYDFQNHELVRQALRRIAGDGILFAEGEQHKVNLTLQLLLCIDSNSQYLH